MFYIGFDIGGSSLKAVLVKDQRLIRSQLEDLPSNRRALFNLISKIVKELAAEPGVGPIKGIGFSLPGPLDLKRERILRCPNIKYLDNQPVKKILGGELKYPIRIEHDVHCFLLAEKKIGLAKNLKNVFYLTLGTGIGGAWMVDGRISRGAHGAAGEIGHMILEMRDERSEGKEFLELEDLAASKFLKKILGAKKARRAAESALSGNRQAEKALGELGKNLGIGLANIINIFDPEAIILGGGITLAQKFLTPGINQGIKKFVLSPDAQKTKILFSRLADYGGALGATFLFI